MFKLILIAFGLSSDPNYNCLNNLFSMVTVIIHSAFFLQIPFTLFMSHTGVMIIIKLLTTVFIVAIVTSYLLMKYRSNKINKLLNELIECQIETNTTDVTEGPRIAISLVVIIFVSVFAIQWAFSDPVVDSVFDMTSLAIEFRHVFTVTAFHLSGWTVSLQTIYFELYYKYYLIVEQFNEQIERRPMTRDNIVMAQQALNLFIHFQSEIDKYLKIFIYFIVTIIISLNIVHPLFYLVINDCNTSFAISSLSMILLWSSYFVWTLSIFYRKRKIHQKIHNNINLWLNTKTKDIKLSIELKILSKVLVLFESNTNQFFEVRQPVAYV